MAGTVGGDGPVEVGFVDGESHLVVGGSLEGFSRNHHHHSEVVENFPNQSLLGWIWVEIAVRIESAGTENCFCFVGPQKGETVQFCWNPGAHLNCNRNSTWRFVTGAAGAWIRPFEVKGF